MALTEHQLTHAASNVDPEEWLEDARAAIQEALDEDGWEVDGVEEFPDEAIPTLIYEMCGAREPHRTAGEVIADLQRIVVRMIRRRPRSGRPEEAGSPETNDVVGWQRHKEREAKMAGYAREISDETKRIIAKAGARTIVQPETWGGIKTEEKP